MLNNDLNKGFFGFWVNNIRTSFLLIFLIIIAGIFSLYSIPKESSPDVKFGIINISVAYPGVNPIDMDNLITEKIEMEIEDIEGIKKITSSSSVGITNISVELDTDANTREILTDIKDKVDNLKLPEDSTDPNISEISTNSSLIYEALIYGDSELFDDFTLNNKAVLIKNKLEGKYGISDIGIGGVSDIKMGSSAGNAGDYKIKVLLDKSKIELLGLSINNIASQIRANNKDTPIGNFKVGDLTYDFRFDGELANINELGNIILNDNGVSQIKLSDIAEFEVEYPGKSIKKLGGFNKNTSNFISLTFNKGVGANIFDASKNSKKALEDLLKSNTEFNGLNVIYSKDMGDTIEEDYANLANTALSTIILVFFTIIFFVGFREGLIATLLIPISFLVTFIVLDTLGLSLNFLTNFSLVLTLGIAIDTVIVIIEGASEKMKLGFSRKNAILIAVRDFKSPLISGTMTTLVAFLPLMFLPGLVGKFLSFIPITVFSTLLAALVLALTLGSALFLTFMKSKKTYHKDEKIEKNMRPSDKLLLDIDRKNKEVRDTETFSKREKLLEGLGVIYEKMLGVTLNSLFLKLSFIIGPIILLIFTLVFLSPKIGFVLFPSTDEGVLNIEITGKSGLDEDYMSKYLSYIDNSLGKIEEMKVYYTTISNNKISVYVDLLDKVYRTENGLRTVYQVEDVINDDLFVLKTLGLDVSVGAMKGGPPTGLAVGIKLSSDSANKFDALKMVSQDFEDFLNKTKGAKNVVSSSSDSPGQFVFKFDKDKLSNVGLNQNDILSELYFYTNGIKAGSIKSEYEDNEIIVSFKEFENTLTPQDIENIIINTKVGKVRVGDFASFEFKKSVNAITREDGNIIISVGSEVDTGYLPTEIQPLLDEFASKYTFPVGISYIKSGESQENMDLIVSTIKSLFISIFLIFSILVLQFNSFKQPMIVLYSIVLALLGVNIGLYVTGNPYSMPFGIGFIALTGVVVNDAIILIDKMNKSIKHKEEHNDRNIDYKELIIMSGKTRLQPIIVTTLTTVFGVLPLALQDEFWAGLGFTIIFGLFVGSMMTLFVVPILYYGFVVRKKVKKLKKNPIA
ncbi:MAG: efflux RND transporter permease subunit [Candidatus Gracilibacteria bacterium]|nr:efflux RND transporter permease subunit [Candidatus Gracilibacteria bacterium]